MILADTSIWIDHFHTKNVQLEMLAEAEDLLCHPLVIAELALGSLKSRALTIQYLKALPTTQGIETEELLHFVESEKIYSRGVGLVDATLLASCIVDIEPVKLWTRDRRLNALAEQFGVAYQPLH